MIKAFLFLALVASTLVSGRMHVKPDVETIKTMRQHGNVSLNPKLSRMVGQTPAASQSVYVNSGGSDTVGDGSNTNPYATVGKAMASITDASLSKTYSIEIGAGRYTEVSLALKPWVFMIGYVYLHSDAAPIAMCPQSMQTLSQAKGSL